ncbi:MAG: rod shape-determining protein RodA [Candidatus Krumholzibacteriia bacterium]
MRVSRDIDSLLLTTTVMLCIIGLSLIYSVFHPAQGEFAREVDNLYFQRQLIWLCFGIVAMFIGFAVPFRYFETLAYVYYLVCMTLLVLVLFAGEGEGIQRWISIGPMRLQPSEFTKVALLFVWGRILSGHMGGMDRAKKMVASIGLLMAPFLLVLKQPDLGTAIILLVMSLPVLFWRGLRGHQIFFMISPVVAGLLIVYCEQILEASWPFGIYIVVIFIIAYMGRSNPRESIALVVANLGVGFVGPIVLNQLEPYQQSRIINFLNPESDRLGAGWQVFQSKIAIGSGGLSGKGYLEGTQKALEFLPAKHTDFVFSVLGEEMGFVGALLALVLFAVLIARALSTAVKVKSQFASTVCVGIAAYFFFQVFINIAMVTGMAPVTGIPVPFLSYGGSSLVVSCFLVGFLLNCTVRWYEY